MPYFELCCSELFKCHGYAFRQWLPNVAPFLLLFLGVNKAFSERQGNRVVLECPSAALEKNLTNIAWFYQTSTDDPSENVDSSEYWILKYSLKDADLERNHNIQHPSNTKFDTKNYSLSIMSAVLKDTGIYKCRGFAQEVDNSTGIPEMGDVYRLFDDVTKIIINGKLSPITKGAFFFFLV